MANKVSIPELTEAISAPLVAQWEAWKHQDAASNNAIIADHLKAACRIWLHDHAREDRRIDLLADPERLRQLDLAVLNEP